MSGRAPRPASALRNVALAAFVAFASYLAWLAPARAELSAEQAGRQVAETYGVEVLDVAEGEVDDRSVWMVTVMNPGGNSNAAFQVNTLAVDRQTGELVPSFRHKHSGYVLPPGGRGDKIGVRPDSMRTGTWR